MSLSELEAAVDEYISTKTQRSKRNYDDLIEDNPTGTGHGDGDENNNQDSDNTSRDKHEAKSARYETGGYAMTLDNLALIKSSFQSKHYRSEFELLSKMLPVRLVE